MVKDTTRNVSSKACISGRLETDLEYSHQFLLEHFYKTRVAVQRRSGTVDYVPIIVSEVYLNGTYGTNLKGKYVEVEGSFRSRNTVDSNGISHLELFLFATTFIVHFDENEIEGEDSNSIFLEGILCKTPVYRTTPSWRDITDLFVAIHHHSFRDSYIPCIAWGRLALYASELQIGDRIQLNGRIQSREYTKLFPDSTSEVRVVYEISVVNITKVCE